MPLLELREETVGYSGTTVLRDLELDIAQGERIALVGESGAGKSTLLNLIHTRLGETAALVPQELGLVQALTVFHNVYMGRLHQRSIWRNLRNLLKPAKIDVDLVIPVLQRLRLDDKLFTSVGELSGGQQQRTAVGRALFHPGDILIADEPVSAVDEHQAREILDAITAEKPTVILAMHDRELAIQFADRLIGLRDGKVALDVQAAGMTPADLDDLYRNTDR
ncbi:MAG: ATP-binding cassette domain-containing protein [Alphaproteobacteria bacterium]|nr:ATP-binding cassette domain-containing protein [Alphaproteobacteria bacterium]